jgi:hypothetical protein
MHAVYYVAMALSLTQCTYLHTTAVISATVARLLRMLGFRLVLDAFAWCQPVQKLPEQMPHPKGNNLPAAAATAATVTAGT